MTEKSASTNPAPLEVTRWHEIDRCRIEVDDDTIADGAKSAAECLTPSDTPGKKPTSIGLTLARTYLEARGCSGRVYSVYGCLAVSDETCACKSLSYGLS